MPSRLPEFCKTINCPIQLADRCRIDREWVMAGWLSNAGKEKERARILVAAIANPHAVLEACKQGEYRLIGE